MPANARTGLALLQDPRELVLLSHFDEWHSALNAWPTVLERQGESEDDYDRRWGQVADEFHARLEAAGATRLPISGWPADLRREIEQTWERMFDQAGYGRYDYWQATVHELHAAQVIEAVRIV